MEAFAIDNEANAHETSNLMTKFPFISLVVSQTLKKVKSQ